MLARVVTAAAAIAFVLGVTVPAHASGMCAEVQAPDSQHTTVTVCTP